MTHRTINHSIHAHIFVISVIERLIEDGVNNVDDFDWTRNMR